MKKRIIIVLCLTLCICTQGMAQQIKASNEALTEVLEQVQQKTDYRFYWMPEEVKNIKANVDADAKDMGTFLKTLLTGTGLRYTIYGNRSVFLLKTVRW